jgi:hypothetical protein
MKGTIVLLIFLMMASLAFAQTCSGTWALTANGNCVTTGFVTGTAITRVCPAPVPTISYSATGAGSNKWNTTTLNTGRYYQYTITATADIVITNLSLIMQSNTNNMHVGIRYSLDGFTTYTSLLGDYAFSSGNPYTYSNSSLSIPMANGQILTVRTYGWSVSLASRIFYNRNMVIAGYRPTAVTDYFRTKAVGNWNQTSTWESSADGLTWVNATLTPTATANMVTINHAVTLTAPSACGNLTFASGSINLGNFNLTINGALSGTPYYTYSGSGVPSKTGTNAFITVTIINPTSLPAALNTLSVAPGSGNSILLPNNVNTTVLAFTNGSITLGNYQIVVTGSTTGTSLFIYNGSGGLSGSGATNSNTVLNVNTSNTIPPVVNAIDVNPGVGNIAELPNNVTTTFLTFTSGALSFNGYSLTLANEHFSITGTQTVAAMDVSLANVAHTFGGGTSIARTWQTSGTVVGTVDLTFSYPPSESNFPQMRAFKRTHVDGESQWTYIGTFNAIDHGTYFSVTVPGITALNDGRGDLDWTLTKTDQTLPIELTSFTATFTYDRNITLNWTTNSETDVLGYHVFRNTENIFGSANCLTQALIPATNTSSIHSYSYLDDEVGTEHIVYYYWLQYTEFSGHVVLNGPITIEVNNNNGTPTVIPEATSIQSVFPNPFQNYTTIRYGLKTDDKVTIEVFNIKGQLVSKLVSVVKDAGTYDITWNGRDQKGTKCSSGVYYIVMNTGSVHNVNKVIKY